MMAKTSPQVLSVAILIAATLCIVTGCGDASSGGFTSYSQLGNQTKNGSSKSASVETDVVQPVEPAETPSTKKVFADDENAEPVAAIIPDQLETETEVQTPPTNPPLRTSRFPPEPPNKNTAPR